MEWTDIIYSCLCDQRPNGPFNNSGIQYTHDQTLDLLSRHWLILKSESVFGQEKHKHSSVLCAAISLGEVEGTGRGNRGDCVCTGRTSSSGVPVEMVSSHLMQQDLHRDWRDLLVFHVLAFNLCTLHTCYLSVSWKSIYCHTCFTFTLVNLQIASLLSVKGKIYHRMLSLWTNRSIQFKFIYTASDAVKWSPGTLQKPRTWPPKVASVGGTNSL